MKINCIKLKFNNTVYVIRDLEIDSRSLNTQSIISKLFTEDYKVSTLSIDGTEREVPSKVLKDKISTSNKSSYKDIISIIEDDSVLFKDIADNLIGNASLNSLNSLMRIHGSKAHENIKSLTRILKNTKIFSGNDNFIKISNSTNENIDIFMGDNRSVIHIPYKILSSPYKIYQALSYLIVDSNLKNPNSKIYKLLNEYLNSFLKVNYKNNEKFLSILNDLLKLNTESQLKTFLYYIQSDVLSDNTNFDNAKILQELSNEVLTMFNAQNKDGNANLDIDVKAKSIINAFPDIFNNKITLNSKEYSVKSVLDLSSSLYNVNAKIKNFGDLIKLGSTGKSSNNVINNLLIDIREKNSNLYNIKDSEYK